MRLADRRCHLVLNYIAAMQQQGVVLSAGDVKAYAARAERKPRGGWRDLQASWIQNVEGRVREGPLLWLYRVRWVDLHGPTDQIEDEDRVTITEIGKAALRALDESAAEQVPASSTVVLDADDPTALAKVIEQIMGMGSTALIDRYFGHDVFLAAAQRTKIERILTGPRPEKRIAGIQQALADVAVDRRFEVRVDGDDRWHDRFIIPDSGSIWALGTSMNGVGARLSVMTEIKGPPAEAIRRDFENAWTSGRRLEPNPLVEERANGDEQAVSGEDQESKDGADDDGAAASPQSDPENKETH